MGVAPCLVYCKVLLRSLLVLAVLLLAYLLGGVAPTSAALPTLVDWAAVRGTDNGVYVASFWSDGGTSSWKSLGGSTPSPPGICEDAGLSEVIVAVRGTDNGIYLNRWTGEITGWSGWAPPPGGGATIDTPACASTSGNLLVVVRGAGNELYWNKFTPCIIPCNGWSGWQDLHGASASAPVLVSTPSLSRVDLFVQGTDNGIYHKAFTGFPGAWSSWDSPGGATLSKPAAAFFTQILGCPSSCFESDALIVVVRGTDDNVYWNVYLIGTGWESPVWGSLKGATLSAPTLAYDANGCTPGTKSDCNSIDALVVRGTDNAVYHKTITAAVSASWDSPGGAIYGIPALAYVPGTSGQFSLLVEGGGHNLYRNYVTDSTWYGYWYILGATPSDPALVAVV